MEHKSDLLTFDQQHIWHPYEPLLGAPPPYEVVSASGCTLKLRNIGEVVDGMSSWWCAIHGYNHPRLNKAIRQQLESMSHVMFGGLTHEPAIRLAQKLIQMTPDPLQNVFFSDSGSVAVEVAIKMAMQYWFSQDRKEKKRLLTLRNGYHGDTFGAMSVCDPESGMHHMFGGMLPQHLFINAPTCRHDDDFTESDIEELSQTLAAHHHEIAALILEPIVQGAGGMRFYCPEFLRQARRLCDQYEVLLIADEIATGFGRSGTLFACDRAGITPDIMCVGKALTGGYISFAATLTTEEVGEVLSYQGPGALMHGPTFMANPLACAVALASLELLEKSNWQQRVDHIERQLTQGLLQHKGHAEIADIRVLGAIGVIETKHPVDITATQSRLIERGIWLRPFGNLLYTMPPYIIADDELELLTQAMGECLVVRRD